MIVKNEHACGDSSVIAFEVVNQLSIFETVPCNSEHLINIYS